MILQSVRSLSGIPGAVAFAVAKYSAAVYVEVPVFVSVPLTPGALYAIVFVAVKAGVLTKSVIVTSPLDGGGVDEAAADNGVPELAGVVMEASVTEPVVADDVEAGEAESEAEADTEKVN